MPLDLRTRKLAQLAVRYSVFVKPGEKVIVPPPKTVAEMEEREKSDYEMIDFYLAKKELKL